MAALNVGPAASDRASVTVAGNTVIDLANASNATGLITTITCFVNSQITACKFGVFFLVSGSTYQCRSAFTSGVLTTGLKTLTAGVSLRCNKGDFIGVYHATGAVDRVDTGGTSAYYVGDVCTVGASQSFTTASQARIISVHGLGAGWANISKVNGVAVTAISKVYDIEISLISKFNGVAV